MKTFKKTLGKILLEMLGILMAIICVIAIILYLKSEQTTNNNVIEETKPVIINIAFNDKNLKIIKKNIDISAYSPRVCETDSTPNITANNKNVREGIIAVSRDIFNLCGGEFGGVVVIPSLDLVLVIDDLMNERWKWRGDIFFFSTEKAIKFGLKKNVEVYIIPDFDKLTNRW
jgi:3D (Asp-Asp-Asp) domain-containing protein